MDTKRLDDFRKLLGQTQLAVNQLKGDASAIRGDLRELRSLGDHLGQGYTRLGDICRLTEKRSELTVDVLDAIEKRIEPLEVVRDLSVTAEGSFASLKQLAEEVMQCGARFEAQKEAIDQAREEAMRVARLMDGLQARVTLLTERSEWLGQAEETVGRLEHRVIETTSLLERRVSDYETQKPTIEEALTEARRVTAILSALEKRIASLAGGGQGLGHAEVTIGQLERRAAETTFELERRVSDFDAQRQMIDQAVTEATRVTTILSALEGRVTALTGSEQGLGHAETAIGQLEQRAAATMSHLERRIGDFDAQKQTLEQALVAARNESEQALGQAEETIGWLEERTAETTAQLERRVSHCDTRKQTIEQALIAALTESGRGLELATATVGRLGQQAVQTTAQLERRVNDFEARKHTIEHALAVARDESDRSLAHAEETINRLGRRAVETTACLDQRVNDFEAQKHTIEQSVIVALAASDQGLERAAGTVGQLEQRAATTAAQLDQRITDFDTQKQTIEQAVAEATRVTAILSALEQRVATLAGSRDGLTEAEATVGQLERRAAAARVRLEQVATDKHEPRRPLLRWATILAALIALELLGIFMLRTRDQPVRMARTAPVVHQSRVAAAVSTLPSKETRLAMFVMPAGSPGAPTTTIAASEPSPANRHGPARATRTQPTAGVPRAGESANQTVQPYVGLLLVDSEPTGSAVFVDRQHVGETPLELTRLRAGSHVVRIERDGYDRWTMAVLVAADKQTRVSARLQAQRDR